MANTSQPEKRFKNPRNQDLERLHFTIGGSDGRPMATDLSYQKNGNAQSLVIYAHGINGFKDWGGMDLVAEYFAARGAAFLKFNFSHNGTTPSRPLEFFDLEAYGHDSYLKRQFDLQEIFKHVQRFRADLPFDFDQICLIGHSRGGTDALLFANQETSLHKLITWSAPSEATTPWRKWDSDAMKSWAREKVYHLKNGRTGQELPVYYELYEEYRRERNHKLNTEAAARSLTKPWLIAHGEADESVFIDEAYRLKQWQPAAETVVIPKAGHTYGRKHPWESAQLPEETVVLADRCLDFILEK